MNKAPIVGFIRYSCRASFTRDDFFQPKYLDYRLNIFKNVTLKSFQEQTDKEFNILLLHSVNLPQKYKEIFKELENNNTFLHNIYIPDSELEGKDYINVVESSVDYADFRDDVSINFRIDNDDAVPCDYITRLKKFLKLEFTDYVISFPNISIIQRTHKNKFLKQEKYFPSNSIGLAYVTNKNDYKTIMTLGDHGKVNEKHPMVLLPGRGGIQTINGKNIMNSLYLAPVSAFNFDSLKVFLKENGYSDFDFKCLNIKKRRVILETIAKAINFIKKRKRPRK
jgi:hypothetical protein